MPTVNEEVLIMALLDFFEETAIPMGKLRIKKVNHAVRRETELFEKTEKEFNSLEEKRTAATRLLRLLIKEKK